MIGVAKIQKLTKLISNKKLVVLLGLASLIIIAAASFLILRSNPHAANKNVCSNETIESAAKVLGPSYKNQLKLKKVVDTVEKMPNYDQDANCLYITLSYYINIGSLSKANELIAKLEKTYSLDNSFSSRLGDDAKTKTINSFKKDIKFLETVSKEIEHNTVTTGGP